MIKGKKRSLKTFLVSVVPVSPGSSVTPKYGWWSWLPFQSLHTIRFINHLVEQRIVTLNGCSHGNLTEWTAKNTQWAPEADKAHMVPGSSQREDEQAHGHFGITTWAKCYTGMRNMFYLQNDSGFYSTLFWSQIIPETSLKSWLLFLCHCLSTPRQTCCLLDQLRIPFKSMKAGAPLAFPPFNSSVSIFKPFKYFPILENLFFSPDFPSPIFKIGIFDILGRHSLLSHIQFIQNQSISIFIKVTVMSGIVQPECFPGTNQRRQLWKRTTIMHTARWGRKTWI